MSSNEEKPFSSSLAASIMGNGDLRWEYSSYLPFGDDKEALNILFPRYSYVKERHALDWLKSTVQEKHIDWIRFEKGRWLVDLDALFGVFPRLHRQPWAAGKVEPIFELDHEETEDFGRRKKETTIRLIIRPEEIKNSMPRKIFLSHKGVDKPKVREFFTTLQMLGFMPWLDEDAMVAGVPLERALLSGMKESCAAVFFVTPSYLDENYLETEINYAMSEKRSKKDRFSIITLVLSEDGGKKGNVPELLKQYVWKEPASDLVALQEIVRALPIEPSGIDWR